jgi:hypothetical protein
MTAAYDPTARGARRVTCKRAHPCGAASLAATHPIFALLVRTPVQRRAHRHHVASLHRLV